MKLRTSKPAPARSIIERAISPMSNEARSFCASRGEETEARSNPLASSPDERRAGSNPKSSALPREIAIVNQNTGPLRLTLVSLGMSLGPKLTMALSAQCAKSNPAAPPRTASNKPSVSIWRTSRARPAPRARRMVSSRFLAVARASSKLEMLSRGRFRCKAPLPAFAKVYDSKGL